MNVTELYHASVALVDTENWARNFLYDMRDANSSLSNEELGTIKMLSDTDWPRVWKPDHALAILRRWQQSRDFDMMAEVAVFKQGRGTPTTFVRYFNQLNPELFPLQALHNCQLLYGPEFVLPPDKAAKEVAEPFFYGRTFGRVRDFLSSLPVDGSEKVFVARSSPETLIMEWRLFVAHWDIFYCNRFCTLNVINERHDWFIFAHMERMLIWGCTEEYAATKNFGESRCCPRPVNYMEEVPKASKEFAEFQRSIINEYWSS